MSHLSTEELLLLADDELGRERAAHAEGCAGCRCALGALQGELTAISSGLHSRVLAEPIDDLPHSWLRLETSMRALAAEADLHLSGDDLLLHLDGELPVARIDHLERCRDCHSAFVGVQELLRDVEFELRSLIPAETAERKAAAVAAFEKALAASLLASEQARANRAPAPTVVEFPQRRWVRFAAAAAAAFALVGGTWLWNQAPLETVPVVVAIAQAPEPVEAFVAAAIVIPETTSDRLTIEQTQSGETKATALERFLLARANVVTQPAPMRRAAPAGLGPVLGQQADAPTLPAQTFDAFAVSAPLERDLAPGGVESVLIASAQRGPREYLKVLEGRRLQMRAGVWREDVRPEVAQGALVFVGSVENASAAADYRAAVEREARREKLDGEIRFELALRRAAAAVTFDSMVDLQTSRDESPAGGLMRSALVAHYSDALRRSFRPAAPTALDGEITRYVSQVFQHQSELLEHAYALKQTLADAEPAPADVDPRQAEGIVSEVARYHLAEAARLETGIYDLLSEALPRRYWNYRGDTADIESLGGSSADSQALLDDVLELEVTLATLLNSSSGVVDARDRELSTGALLHRVHARLRHLKTATRNSL